MFLLIKWFIKNDITTIITPIITLPIAPSCHDLPGLSLDVKGLMSYFNNGATLSIQDMLSRLDLNREIPPELYQVIAEVLAWVYKVNKDFGENAIQTQTNSTEK